LFIVGREVKKVNGGAGNKEVPALEFADETTMYFTFIANHLQMKKKCIFFFCLSVVCLKTC